MDNSQKVQKKISNRGIYVIVAKPEKTNKTILGFLKGMPKNQKGAVVCLGNSYASQIKSSNLFFIDCTGAKIPQKSGKSLKRAGSLTELSLEITNALQKNKADFLVFDMIENLLVYNDQQTVEKFILFFVNKLRYLSIAGFFFITSEKSKIANVLIMSSDEVMKYAEA